MIRVEVPDDNVAERRYILDTLLSEFLGLSYSLTTVSGLYNWRIVLDNGNELRVEDHFFSHFPIALSYLRAEAIPDEVCFVELDLAPEGNIPIIYGGGKIIQETDVVVCTLDIFASAFFMLTRWEEYVLDARDSHDRFPAKASLAYRNGFLDRPVVNEYVEILWRILKNLGLEEERKERRFSIFPTHDVDSTYYWITWRFILKTLAGDLLKRKSPGLFFDHAKSLSAIIFGFARDPFDTFSDLMRLSDSHNVKSHFFFMCGGNSKFDNAYQLNSRRTKKLISRIVAARHEVGIHPSYNTYQDPKRLKGELDLLTKVSKRPVTTGRQHVLRYDIVSTPRIWDSLSMAWDSTLGYAEHNGFRAGVCYEFSMFDFLSRRKLNLKQKPLLFMEVTDFKYRKLSLEQSVQNTQKLIQRVRNYNGEFVFLWHNSNIDRDEWRERFRALYLPILASIT